MPGYGWARRMRLKDRGDTLALTAVFSICATIAVGTAMAVTGWWSPVAGFAVLVLIALCGFMPFRRTAADQQGRRPETRNLLARGRKGFPAARGLPRPRSGKGIAGCGPRHGPRGAGMTTPAIR